MNTVQTENNDEIEALRLFHQNYKPSLETIAGKHRWTITKTQRVVRNLRRKELLDKSSRLTELGLELLGEKRADLSAFIKPKEKRINECDA